MPIEKSAGAVIFRKQPRRRTPKECKHPTGQASYLRGKNNKIYYLLLHYQSGARRPYSYWDFPKGHIEKGEKLEDTIRREVGEETGIEDIKLTPGFKEVIKYFFKFRRKNIFKIVTYFLAETKSKEVKISREHIGHKWLFYDKALERLTFQNTKEILTKANQFLMKN